MSFTAEQATSYGGVRQLEARYRHTAGGVAIHTRHVYVRQVDEGSQTGGEDGHALQSEAVACKVGPNDMLGTSIHSRGYVLTTRTQRR